MTTAAQGYTGGAPGMYLDNPRALWLIPVGLLLLLGFGIWGWQAKRELALLFRVEPGRLRGKHIGKHLAAGALVALGAGALASPQIPFSIAPLPVKTGEVALLVDVSTSMAARRDPTAPSIMDRTKSILKDIVDHMQELDGVKVGLYVFTDMARSQVPFVDRQDYPYLRASIDKVLNVGSAPGSGSGFGRPIMDVTNKFSKDAKVKLIVLFSDGEAFVEVSRGMQGTERGLIEQAMTQTRLEKVKVITVGVGEPEGAKIPIFSPDGNFSGQYARLHDADMSFFLKEEALREIASRTGGAYFGENDRRGLIGFIEENLDTAPAEQVAGQAIEYRSIANWLILAGLPFWAVLARLFQRG
jgi:hypothetical protein